jgi:hypothetical protein
VWVEEVIEGGQGGEGEGAGVEEGYVRAVDLVMRRMLWFWEGERCDGVC